MPKSIIVRGAREHNLKNISLEIPRDRLVVITGISGSGKSSLAFDTIYAEGQRRYVESLSTHARIFLEQMGRPDVDLVEGLSPAVSIEQKGVGANPRSTVGTITEIYDFLRLLFARAGEPHCPSCGKRISFQTVQEMVDAIMALPDGTRFSILAPAVSNEKGDFKREIRRLRSDGFIRVNIDGELHDLADDLSLDPHMPHRIEVYIDRLVRKPGIESRLADSLELALKNGRGLVTVAVVEGPDLVFSESFSCIDCGLTLPSVEPKLFSFNTPFGACPACGGIGRTYRFVEERVVPDPRLSLKDGAIAPWRKRGSGFFQQLLEALARTHDIDLYRAWEDLPNKARQIILHGTRQEIPITMEDGDESFSFKRKFEGVLPGLERRLRERNRKIKDRDRGDEPEIYLEDLESFLQWETCGSCKGRRLRPESLAVQVGGRDISEVSHLDIRKCIAFFEGLRLGSRQGAVADKILREIRLRLGFLIDVGLDYLSLDRPASTLSAGEGQRIRLASQIGSSLVGVLYVLDEPSIGLHPRDNERLLKTLTRLRDMGNSVLVVEHDRETILASDYVIDMGPGAGAEGGDVIACGTPEQIMKDPASITGLYLSRKRTIPAPLRRRVPDSRAIVIHGASVNNLKRIDVRFPLGLLIAVTGVSGSGKSSLVVDTLLPALKWELSGAKADAGTYEKLAGIQHVRRVVNVDQAPIGRTPRSNPATYSGVFAFIRDLFASLPESRARGYRPGRYSFNIKGGRCEACQGDGLIRVEMNFLPDVYVDCEVCGGSRYNRETLEIRFKGKSIADVLGMTANEAYGFLENVPRIREKLQILREVGLGYIRLGQSATTLSGGEAQRLKLSRELGRRSGGGTLYLLDEPTTGLHFADIERLLSVLHSLVDAGNTVVVIEHNLDIVKCADWVIDLGPEGGDAGGRVVASGRPEDIAKVEASHTGRYLNELFKTEMP